METSKYFIEGPVPAEQASEWLVHHISKTKLGAHAFFTGQVRADIINDKTVCAIEYTAYEEMAAKVFHEIREEALNRMDNGCIHILHSLGTVKAGQLSMLVMVSGAHRQEVFENLRFIVEAIKEKVPVFGKELLDDGRHTWKKNK